jgi:hypothetical protein
MLQRQRMILEGRMQIRLRGMPGVARLGEQGEVGQAQLRHQARAFGRVGPGRHAQPRGIDEAQREGADTHGQQQEGAIGGAHHRSLRTAATTLSVAMPSGSSSMSFPSGPTT